MSGWDRSTELSFSLDLSEADDESSLRAKMAAQARAWLRQEAPDGTYLIASIIEEGIKVETEQVVARHVDRGTHYRTRRTDGA